MCALAPSTSGALHFECRPESFIRFSSPASDSIVSEALARLGSPIVVASFPRSGTHLAIDMLRRHIVECRSWKRFGERSDHLYLSFEALAEMPADHPVPAVIKRLRRSPRPIVKTHCWPDFGSQLPAFRPWVDWLQRRGSFICAYRDPRLVLCSLYAARRGLLPLTLPLSLTEFLRVEWDGMSLPARWAAHVTRWLAVDGCIPLNYQRVIDEPRAVMIELAKRLELKLDLVEPLLPPATRGRWHGRWLRLVSRRPASTALNPGELRRAPSPKWREAFTPDDCRFVHEQVGETMIRLGLESSDAWVSAKP